MCASRSHPLNRGHKTPHNQPTKQKPVLARRISGGREDGGRGDAAPAEVSASKATHGRKYPIPSRKAVLGAGGGRGSNQIKLNP